MDLSSFRDKRALCMMGIWLGFMSRWDAAVVVHSSAKRGSQGHMHSYFPNAHSRRRAATALSHDCSWEGKVFTGPKARRAVNEAGPHRPTHTSAVLPWLVASLDR
jgi:hypothetical protein